MINLMSKVNEPVKKNHRTILNQFIVSHDDDQTFISNSTAANQTIDEFDKYLKISIGDQYEVLNPLIFWHRHQEKFPYLAKLGRLLYLIPATSAYVERKFRADDLRISERRSLLNLDTVENVLVIPSI